MKIKERNFCDEISQSDTLREVGANVIAEA